MKKLKDNISVLSLTRPLFIILLTLLLSLTAFAAEAEEEIEPGGGEILVEITLPDEESVVVETGSVDALSAPSEADMQSLLQTEIEGIIEEAVDEGDSDVYIYLEESSYDIGTLLLHDHEGDVETIEIHGVEGGTRINGNVDVKGIIVTLIDIILGGDKTLQVENLDGYIGSVEGGTVAEGERLNVLISVDDEDEDYSESTVELETSPGAQVVAELEAGTLKLTDTDAEGGKNTVTISGKNSVSVSYGRKRAASVKVSSKTEGTSTVNLGEITAKSADIIVSSAVVNLRGEMDVNSLKVIASSEVRNLVDLAPDFLDNIPGVGGYTKNLAVRNVADHVVVNILRDITAQKSIAVYAYITQDGKVLQLPINLGVNVKVGNAEINVADGVTLRSGEDVTLKSTVRAEAGYNQYGRKEVAKFPVSFNVFVDRALVTLGDNVSIVSGGDITADAMSTILASACCRIGSAPVALAVNVIVNEAAATLGKGVSMEAQGDINVCSAASTDASAVAERGTGSGVNGVFLATNVVIQSSEAGVTERDALHAAGNVNIRSRSDAVATDDAISSASSAVNSGEKAADVKTLVTSVVSKLFTQTLNGFLAGDIMKDYVKGPISKFMAGMGGKLAKATKLLANLGYTVTLDKSAQEKGSVTVMAGDDAIRLKIDSKYQIEKVLVRYLLSATSGTTAKPDEVYTFGTAKYDEKNDCYVLKFTDVNANSKVVTNPEFLVYVFYGELKDELELDELTENEDDDDFNLADFFDSALYAASDENEEDEDCTGNIQLLYQLKLNGKAAEDKGTVITNAINGTVSANLSAASGLTHVGAGKTVRFNPNPAQGYALKSMTLRYTNTNGEEKTVAIEENGSGHYLVTIPTDVKGSVTIEADFTEAEDAASGIKTPSKKQTVGALGVGVIVNSNTTLIAAEGGQIAADGDVNILAEAVSELVNTADGTAVGQADADKTRSTHLAPSSATMAVHSLKEANSGEQLLIIGTVENEKTCSITRSGNVYTIQVNAATDMGYSLGESITLRIIDEANRRHDIPVKGKNGCYVLDLSKVDLKNDCVSETEIGLPVYRSLSFVSRLSLRTYKLKGAVKTHLNPETKLSEVYGTMTVDASTICGNEVVKITMKPKDGYTVDYVTLTYTAYRDAEKKDAGDTETVVVVPTALSANVYTLTIPAAYKLAESVDGVFTINADFVKSDTPPTTYKVNMDEKSGICLKKIEAVKPGDTVKLSLTEDLKSTRRLNLENLVLEYTNDKGAVKTIEVDEATLSFSVPNDIKGDISISTKSGTDVTTEMRVKVQTDAAVTNGKLTPQTETTCGNSILLVKLTPDSGYVTKSGSVRAEFVGGSTVDIGKGVQIEKNLYSFTVPATVGNGSGVVTVKAEFEKGDEQTSSLGVGAAVSVLVHRNNALVSSGSISAGKNLSILAETEGKAETSALSGFNSATKSICGSAAVEVAGYKTNAILNKAVSFSAEALRVDASSGISSLKTSADAGGKRGPDGTIANSGEELGFGTAVAVAVNGVDSFATVRDGVRDAALNRLQSVSVKAENKINADSVISKAGAKSKTTSVAPVVALNICGSNAEAYLGNAVTEDGSRRDYSARKLEVYALSSIAHSMELDAGAASDGLKSGTMIMAGAFGINILNDLAKAILNAGVLADEAAVSVEALSESSLQASVKASASGAGKGKKDEASGKGSADTKADAIVKSGTKLSAANGTQATAPTTVNANTANRQTAQTSEGSIAGAAAFALNIQSNESSAIVMDGVSIRGSNGGKAASLSVRSLNRSDANLSADGSAALKKSSSAGSDTAIGVAVAINILFTENHALLGQGDTLARSVLVEAGLIRDEKGEELAHSVNTTAISGSGATGISVAGSVALAVLNTRVEARIEKAKGDSFAADATTVLATDRRSADTTATAAATASGAPDKNSNAGDSGKSADADASKSVGVGASFAMVYGENSVSATLLLPERSDVGELKLSALSEHSESSTSVAGSDPWKSIFGSNYQLTGKSSDIAVDASVAVNAIETVVKSVVSAATSEYVPVVTARSVRLTAREKGKSSTSSSGFALGGDTAVGAAVAVNLNSSRVESRDECVLKVSGDDGDDDEEGDPSKSVSIYALSEVSEENLAFATALGTDLLRYVEKWKSVLTEIGKKVEKVELLLQTAIDNVKGMVDLMQSLLDGSLIDMILENLKSSAMAQAKNKVNETISGLFNKKKKAEIQNTKKADSFLPVSVNMLRVFGIGTPDSAELDAVSSKANKETNAAVNGSDPTSDKSVSEALKEAGATGNVQTVETADNAKLDKEAESFQLAAAVALSLSAHDILAESSADIMTAGGVSLKAESKINSLAHACGAAVSTNGGIGSIAMAVAVKVDETSTTARAGGSILVGSGREILISAKLEENLDDDYRNRLGTQAVAGAVSGDAKVAISGAVAVFVSAASTVAELCENARAMAASGSADCVTIEATEALHQTLRTVAAAASSAKLTLGASVGSFVSKNTLRACVGQNARVRAKTIRVKAQRRSSANSTDSGELEADSEEAAADYGSSEAAGSKTVTGVSIKGLVNSSDILSIDTKKATVSTPQTVSVSVNADMLMEKLETALNSLSHVDTYIAIDSGAVGVANQSASGLGSIAGSIGVVLFRDSVETLVESGAVLESEENCELLAESEAQSRVIGGAVSVNTNPQAKAAVGAVIAFVKESSLVSATVEDEAQLLATGLLTLRAAHEGLTELYTVTATVSASSGEQAAGVAATINVLLSEAEARMKLGSGKAHKAAKASIEAVNGKSLTIVTVSPAVGNAKVQVGGAVTALVEESRAIVTMDQSELTISGIEQGSGKSALSVLAENRHNMTLATASASAGSSTVSVAGVVSVVVDSSEASVSALGSRIRSSLQSENAAERYKAGDVSLAAKNSSKLLQVNVEASAGKASVATGASILVSVLRRRVQNDVCEAEIIVGNGNLDILAEGEDTQAVVGIGAGATTGIGVQGNILAVVEENEVCVLAQNARLTALRGNNLGRNDISLRAAYSEKLYGVAGTLNVAAGSVAAGATVVVLVNSSVTETDVSGAILRTPANVNLTAKADNELLLVSVGVGVSGSNAVQASIATAVNSDTVRVKLGKASVYCYKLVLDALGSSKENLVAGSADAGSGVSVGPALLVFVKNRSVEILSDKGGSMGSSDYSCAIAANALANDNTSTLVIAAGGGNVAVQAGVCVEIIRNNVVCDFDAETYAGNQSVSFRAASESELTSYAFGGGFGATAAVVPVITVIYQQSRTLAEVSSRVHGLNLDVLADSAMKLRAVGAGASAAGTAAVSGSFAIVVNKSSTKARFIGSFEGDAQKSIVNVKANDSFDFDSKLITLAGGGVAGVGVTAAVSVMGNTVEAAIEGESAVERSTIVARTVSVAADSVRNVNNLTGTVGVGGAAGAAVNVAVLVTGSKLPQDAYDSLVYANGKEADKTFDADAFLAQLNESNSYLSNHNLLQELTLSTELSGNGQYDSSAHMGNESGISTEGVLPEEITGDDEDFLRGSGESMTEKDSLRGENEELVPTEDSDLASGSELAEQLNYSYENAIEDSIRAWIDNCIVHSETTEILAHDTQNVNMNCLTAGIGVDAGGGVGVAVVVLHSSVFATLGANAESYALTLDVRATSDSDESGITVLGGVFGGGLYGGAAAAVAVVHMDNVVAAALNGKAGVNPVFSGVSKVYLNAESSYSDISAETAAAAFGAIAVDASVAVVSLNGSLSALLRGSVEDVSELYVMNLLSNSVAARAGNLAGGIGTINAGVSVASESLSVRAAIEEGAVVRNVGELTVLNVGSFDREKKSSANAVTKVHAENVGVSIGAVNAGAAVAVAKLRNTVSALIDGSVTEGERELNVKLLNRFETEALSDVVAANNALAALGANVLLSYNDSRVEATVSGEVRASGLSIASFLSADSKTSMKSLNATLASLGVNVAYAELSADNSARILNGSRIEADALDLYAGGISTSDYAGGSFKAEADIFSGSVSGINVGVNLALAVNKAVNRAVLEHSGTITAGTLTMKAFGNPSAKAKTEAFAANLIGVQGSAASSTLDFEQAVLLRVQELTAPNGGRTRLILGSYLYEKPSKGELSKEDAQSEAAVELNAANLVGINANVAYAKNSVRSHVEAELGSIIGNILAENHGGANASAEMRNAEDDFSILAIGANVALSYAQGDFLTDIRCAGIEGESVRMETELNSDANAYAESSAAGLQLGLLESNVVIAKAKSSASTILSGLSSASTLSAGTVELNTDARTRTEAILEKPSSLVSLVNLGDNVVESIQSSSASAELRSFTLVGSPKLVVKSSLNDDPNSKSREDALARYSGSAGGNDASALKATVNVILAKNYSDNAAILENISGGSDVSTYLTASSHATALSDGGQGKRNDGFTATLVGVGVIVSNSAVESSNTALVRDYTADSKVLSVLADMNAAHAVSRGGVSSMGGMSLVEVDVNSSDAINRAVNKATLEGCGSADSFVNVDELSVKANAEDVYASAYVGTALITLSGVNIFSAEANARNLYEGSATVKDSFLSGSGKMEVCAYENRNSECSLTEATVGASGSGDEKVTLSLISGSGNSAKAVNDGILKAKLHQSTLRGYALSVEAKGRNDVYAAAETGTTVALLNVGVIETEARAGGSIEAEFDAYGESELRSLSLQADGKLNAKSLSSSSGSQVSVGSVDVNTADTGADMLVKAVLSGDRLHILGDATVLSSGSAQVEASSKTPDFVLSGGNLAVCLVNADSHVQIDTELTPESMIVDGRLTVRTLIPEADSENEKSYTRASVEPAGGAESESVKLRLIGGDVNKAVADSRHALTLRLGKDGGSIRAASLLCESVGNAYTEAITDAHGENVGLFTVGNLEAEAIDEDSSVITLGGSIVTTGEMDVESRNDSAAVNAEGHAPGALGGVDISVSNVNAYVKKNVAGIEVLDNARLRSEELGITLLAKNAGHGESVMHSGDSYTLGKIDESSVPVTMNFETYIRIGNGSDVKAKKNLNIGTGSVSDGKSSVDQNISALIFNIATMYGKCKITDATELVLGENAKLTSQSGDVALNLMQNADATALTLYNASTGVFGEGGTRSEAEYSGLNRVVLGDNAAILAESGKLSIVQDSSSVTVLSSAENRGCAFAAAGDVNAIGTVGEVMELTLGEGAELSAGGELQVKQLSGSESADTRARLELDSTFSEGSSTANASVISAAKMDLRDGVINAAEMSLSQDVDKLQLLPTAISEIQSSIGIGDVDTLSEGNLDALHEIYLGEYNVSGAMSYSYRIRNAGQTVIKSNSSAGTLYVNNGDTMGKLRLYAGCEDNFDPIESGTRVDIAGTYSRLEEKYIRFEGNGRKYCEYAYGSNFPDGSVNDDSDEERKSRRIIRELVDELEDSGLLDRASRKHLSELLDEILKSGLEDELLPENVGAAYVNRLSAAWLKDKLDGALYIRIEAPYSLADILEDYVVLSLVSRTEENGMIRYHLSDGKGTLDYYLVLNLVDDSVELYRMDQGERINVSAIYWSRGNEKLIVLYDETYAPRGIWLHMEEGKTIRSSELRQKP